MHFLKEAIFFFMGGISHNLPKLTIAHYIVSQI